MGNSLGGYTALRLAARGRARTVVALAPAGGWAEGDDSYQDTLQHFVTTQDLVKTAAPHAEAIAAIARRAPARHRVHHHPLRAHPARAHRPPDPRRGRLRRARRQLIEYALVHGWSVDAERVTCPVRFIWGTADRLLPWPRAAAGYREALPTADWVVLDDIGHCPQLDVPLETAQLILGFTGG